MVLQTFLLHRPSEAQRQIQDTGITARRLRGAQRSTSQHPTHREAPDPSPSDCEHQRHLAILLSVPQPKPDLEIQKPE